MGRGKRIDTSRQLRRDDPQEAVDIWQGLVSGTWTLVEHFESDGRRYLLALWSAMKKLGVDSRVELLKLMSAVGG